MQRVKFKKGYQRKFLKEILNRTNCPSLRELINRGFDIPYSTLKNYYSEKRLLPLDFFEELCSFSNIDSRSLKINILPLNWGQIKGGKKKSKTK